jgi:hypothetical protein
MQYKCQKCGIKITLEKWIILETMCMLGGCPLKDIDGEPCDFCGASVKERILDALEN